MSGRIRSIKPEVLEDEVAASLSDAAWRLWVSTWTLADDHGNFRAGDRYLAASVWQDTSRDVSDPLHELIAKGLISPYSCNGQRYGHVNGWEKHQRVDNAGKARVPSQESDDGTWSRDVTSSFSARLREPPRLSEGIGEIPLARHARAQSGGWTSDLRPPTSDPDQRTSTIGSASTQPSTVLVPESSESKTRRRRDVPPPSADERAVFDHWQATRARHVRARGTTLLTPERLTKIRQRLREGYSVGDLKAACDGVWLSEFHVDNVLYTDIVTCLRDGAQVEKFRDLVAHERASSVRPVVPPAKEDLENDTSGPVDFMNLEWPAMSEPGKRI